MIKHYKISDLCQRSPAEYSRAIVTGKMDERHIYLGLPEDFQFEPPPPESHVIGLGDVVAVAARPVAAVIDRVFGTDLKHCGGCGERQEGLNAVAPFGKI